MLSLKDKIILITGAASGIGKETAYTLAKLGAKLILVDISQERLNETIDNIRSNTQIIPIALDLSNFSALSGSISDITKSIGPIDGLVHCAGISSRKPLNVLSPSGFSKVMDINFYAFEELTRLLMKKGRFNDGGSIVVMSSISSIRGYKAKTEYCVSKAAVDAFVRCMALELAPRKIRINSVMAAEVLTPLAKKAKQLNESLGVSEIRSPLGPTDPYEVANTIAFLLSDATKTITGTSLLIDGGACI